MELIAVVAILSILLCIAVPNMMNYINAAHEATAQTEARICVDAVQRYLNDEKEKGKLTGGMLLRLMGLEIGLPLAEKTVKHALLLHFML